MERAGRWMVGTSGPGRPDRAGIGGPDESGTVMMSGEWGAFDGSE